MRGYLGMNYDPELLTPAYIVDLFISDCTLPSTQDKEKASDIYNVFVAYCESMEIGVPCGIKHFGKLMKRRFQRRSSSGYAFYMLEYKPGLFDVTD
jgi:hypothetical protein